MSVAEYPCYERRHKVNARLARQHHSMLQRLRRLQPVGVHVRVMHIEADEMAQPVRHEHAMQVESKRIWRAAGNETSRHQVAQQQQRRVAVHIVILRT